MLKILAGVGALTMLGGAAEAADWLMFGYGPRHDGYNPAETILTPANVSTLALKWTYNVGTYKTAVGLPVSTNAKSIDSQPVVAAGVNVNGVSKDILYIGDNGGTFHAVDINSPKAAATWIWARQTNTVNTKCAETGGTSGIKSTAAIDRAANGGKGAVFVANNAVVYAWDLATGATIPGWPDAGVTLPNLNIPTEGTVYSGVTVYNGSVYVTTSSAGCDAPPYHGSINILNESNGALTNQWFSGTGTATPPTISGGSIWGPGGVSIDTNAASPTLFTATGNPTPTLTSNVLIYYFSILGARPDLSSIDWSWKPGNLGGDLDFGSTPVPVNATACSSQLVPVTRKDGSLYVPVINQTTPRTLQRVDQYAISTSQELSFGAVAFDPVSQLILVTTFDDGPAPYIRGLHAMKVGADCTLTQAWQTNSAPNGASIAAPGTRLTSASVANGLAFFGVGNNPSTTAATTGIYAVAVQSANGFGAGQTLWRSPDSVSVANNAPIVVNGRVYVSSNDGKVHAYAIPGH